LALQVLRRRSKSGGLDIAKPQSKNVSTLRSAIFPTNFLVALRLVSPSLLKMVPVNILHLLRGLVIRFPKNSIFYLNINQ